MSIKERLDKIRASLSDAVTLVAVSKRKPADDIMEARAAGHLDFGENRAGEFLEKATALPGDIRWHFIGHLQSKKAKLVVPHAHLIHSVDTAGLIEVINRRARMIDKVQDLLLQIHIAQEENKFGFMPDEVEVVLRDDFIDKYPNVRIRGLMAMATNTTDMKQVGREFARLKQLFDRYHRYFGQNAICSMGMSHDFREALAHGSTMIRVGSAIFGPRD